MLTADEEFITQPQTAPAEDDKTRALRRFAINLLNRLYPQGGWAFIAHPDMGGEVCIGSWPVAQFSWLLTAKLPDGADTIVTLGIRAPIVFPAHYGFTIRRYTGRKGERLPEELCGLPDLNNLDPSDDAIRKAAQLIAEG